MITRHNIEQGSDVWHAARKDKFTGSNAWKLLSNNGDMAYARNQESDFTGNFHTERGHLLETEALEIYESITKSTVNHCGFVTNDLFTDCLYSPDGLTDTHVIEVKCFAEKHHLEIWNADSWLAIPKKILAQIQFGMLITELPAARLVIYNPKLDPKKAFRIIDIPMIDKIQNNFKRILGGVTA